MPPVFPSGVMTGVLFRPNLVTWGLNICQGFFFFFFSCVTDGESPVLIFLMIIALRGKSDNDVMYKGGRRIKKQIHLLVGHEPSLCLHRC